MMPSARPYDCLYPCPYRKGGHTNENANNDAQFARWALQGSAAARTAQEPTAARAAESPWDELVGNRVHAVGGGCEPRLLTHSSATNVWRYQRYNEVGATLFFGGTRPVAGSNSTSRGVAPSGHPCTCDRIGENRDDVAALRGATCSRWPCWCPWASRSRRTARRSGFDSCRGVGERRVRDAGKEPDARTWERLASKPSRATGPVDALPGGAAHRVRADGSDSSRSGGSAREQDERAEQTAQEVARETTRSNGACARPTVEPSPAYSRTTSYYVQQVNTELIHARGFRQLGNPNLRGSVSAPWRNAGSLGAVRRGGEASRLQGSIQVQQEPAGAHPSNLSVAPRPAAARVEGEGTLARAGGPGETVAPTRTEAALVYKWLVGGRPGLELSRCRRGHGRGAAACACVQVLPPTGCDSRTAKGERHGDE